MTHESSPSGTGDRVRRPTTISRRRLLTASAAGLAVAGTTGSALFSPSAHAAAAAVTRWLDQVSRPLAGTDPRLPAHDLRPLDDLVCGASIIGLGEAAHGTHDLFRLKHRLIRYLVEHHGVRTIAWEDTWAAGALVDRYVTAGVGDARQAVLQAGFNLQNQAMLNLVEWMRDHNSRRSTREQVRFLGASVVQLREIQFTELATYVSETSPSQSATLKQHLDELRIREDDPGSHTGWYAQLDDDNKPPFIAHARAVKQLVDDLPDRPSSVSRLDVDLHALSLLGFYESYTDQGFLEDTRTSYELRIIERWRRDHRRPMIYSAANAHTVAADRQIVSFPPVPPMPHSLAGGQLREHLGSRYVSIGLTFNHGQITAGWDVQDPRPYTVPLPDATFIDHDLGHCRHPDYLVDLRTPAPAQVRRWLTGGGTLRVIGGASYDPANDGEHYMTVPSWGTGFDALLHLGSVTPSRLP